MTARFPQSHFSRAAWSSTSRLTGRAGTCGRSARCVPTPISACTGGAATLPPDSNIFASKYQLYLPSKEELKAELEQITRELERKAGA